MPGSIIGVASIVHLYERHCALARNVVEIQPDLSFEMPAMTAHDQIWKFLQLESKLRSGQDVDLAEVKALDPYWRDLLNVLEWYSATTR
jgi:hypothetical protein